MNFEIPKNLSEKNYLEIARDRKIKDKRNLELIEKATNQIEVIKPALRELENKIIEINPDKIVLLSKGADLFKNPLLKYFDNKNLGIEVVCYNDSLLKGKFLSQEMDNSLVESEFSDFIGKKVIFIDETFSAGKGALAINEAIKIGNIKDFYYFALTQDSHKKSIKENLEAANSLINPADFEQLSLNLKKDENFKVSDCSIKGTLFSKDMGDLIKFDGIDQGTGKSFTKRINGKDNNDSGIRTGKIPNANDYLSNEEREVAENKEKELPLMEELLENIISDALI